MIWFSWVLWHFNHCRLFYAKSFLYIFIKYIWFVYEKLNNNQMRKVTLSYTLWRSWFKTWNILILFSLILSLIILCRAHKGQTERKEKKVNRVWGMIIFSWDMFVHVTVLQIKKSWLIDFWDLNSVKDIGILVIYTLKSFLNSTLCHILVMTEWLDKRKTYL